MTVKPIPTSTAAELRTRFRGQYPHHRLILFLDRREKCYGAWHVVAVDRSSILYDFLEPEQLGEIVDYPDEQPHE